VRTRVLYDEAEGPAHQFFEMWTARVLVDADRPLDDLVGAIATGAREVLDEHGVDGYQRRWANDHHPFPEGHLAALERYLTEQQP
jgi:hypothetical protein